MSYDDYNSSSSSLAQLSGKKLIALAICIIVIVFFGAQALFGFPIMDIFRKEVTDVAKVVIKDSQGTCIVEPSDHQPRSIHNCPYKVGDNLVVTYKAGTEPIEKFSLKNSK